MGVGTISNWPIVIHELLHGCYGVNDIRNDDYKCAGRCYDQTVVGTMLNIQH